MDLRVKDILNTERRRKNAFTFNFCLTTYLAEGQIQAGLAAQ